METISEQNLQVMSQEKASILSALNKHGFFFQAACETALRNAEGWVVESPSPLLQLFYNGAITVEAGEADIRASLHHDNKVITLLGECKRQDAALKEWVFLQRENAETEAKVRPELRRIHIGTRAETIPMGYTTYLPDPRIGINWFKNWELPLTEEGRELCRDQGNPSGGFSVKPSRDAVQEAAGQITEALHSMLLEECDLIAAKGKEGNIGGRTDQYFLPVVLTNAKIWICRYDPEKVIPATGTIASANLENADFLLYQKSVPRSLLGFIENGQYTDSTSYRQYRREFNRLQIFVVQGQRFPEFLNYIASKIADIMPS